MPQTALLISKSFHSSLGIKNRVSTIQQATISKKVSCVGIGVHSGKNASLTLHPSAVDTGYVFVRTDIENGFNQIHASYDKVSDTQSCTRLSNSHGLTVSTVEHILAALSGCGITNALIEVNGPEIPIMDGSSLVFCQLIQSVGINYQQNSMPTLKILQPLKVRCGNASAEFVPSFERIISMYFDGNGRLSENFLQIKSFDFNLENDGFSKLLADARTFGFYEDAEKLMAAGLAKGASLDNTVVIDKDHIMNKEGLRNDSELIRHKVLDVIGDLSLGNVVIQGHFKGINSGHSLNNQLLRLLFASPHAWRWVNKN